MQAKIPLILFISLFSLISSTESIPFRMILGDDDYAIVGVNECFLSVEVGVDDNNCIHHMSIGAKQPQVCPPHFSLLYLPQESNSTTPPKIFKIFEVNQHLVYNLENITFPRGLMENNTELKFNQFHYFNLHGEYDRLISFHLTFGVLYNHRSSFLYILSYTDEMRNDARVDIFYMYQEMEYPLKLSHKHLTRMAIDKTFLGTQWSTDPYYGEFYCHKQEFNISYGHMVSRVYAIPFDMLLTNLKRGILGALKKNFELESEKKREFVQVTNGLIYSQSGRYRFIGSLQRLVHGSRCYFYGVRERDFMFVLSGWEYCKIRDGENANITTCLQHENDAQPMTECSNSLLWTIAIAVIANAVILLVILCVVCKYYKHEDHDDGLYMNSHPSKVRTALITPDELFEKRRLNSSVMDI